jgi:copper chaperone CopZ
MNITNRLRLLLVWAVAVLAFGSGLQVAASPPPQNSEQTMKQKTAHMRITGMTCAACAKGLEASFRKMPGIVRADVDYKAGLAAITFDPAKQNTESLSKFVSECGYQVKEIKVV